MRSALWLLLDVTVDAFEVGGKLNCRQMQLIELSGYRDVCSPASRAAWGNAVLKLMFMSSWKRFSVWFSRGERRGGKGEACELWNLGESCHSKNLFRAVAFISETEAHKTWRKIKFSALISHLFIAAVPISTTTTTAARISWFSQWIRARRSLSMKKH